MHLKFYSALCGLSPWERTQLESLFSTDQRMPQIVERSAKIWRDVLKREFPEHLECRRAFLLHSLKIAKESGMQGHEFRALASAFVLALGDLVERRVLEIESQNASAARC